MDNNAYSVVIPAYNAEKHLDETLQSVLAQTIPPVRIIVIDDGSTDQTAKVAANYGSAIEVISTENRGSGAATSTGIATVTTPILATLDSDDLWRPHKMETQLAHLHDPNLKLDAVLAKLQPFGEIDKKTAPVETSGWSRSTLTIWMKSFHKVGDIKDMGNGYGEMIDWFARAKSMGLNFQLLDEVLVDRRIHSESFSFKASENIGQRADFLKAAIHAIERKKRMK